MELFGPATFDLTLGHQLQTFKWDNGALLVDFSYDDTKVLVGSRDGTASIFDFKTEDLITSFESDGWVWSASFSNDGTKVVVGADDGTAVIYDIFF